MSDVTAVKEALELWDNDQLVKSVGARRRQELIRDAARSYVRMVEEGPDYEAAAKALADMEGGVWPRPIDAVTAAYRNDAKAIVDAALADYLTEEE